MSLTETQRPFDLVAPFKPMGDQPRAIAELTEGLQRGDPYQTLLGATGTGKSVGYDDPVFIVERQGKEMIPRVLPIGRLVDEYIERTTHDLHHEGDATVASFTSAQYFTQAFDPESGAVDLYPISAFTRHAAPASMYCLQTTCGRHVTLTGDHTLWVLREGELRLIKTADVRPTDYVPLPETLLAEGHKKNLNTLTTLAGIRLFVNARDAILHCVERHGTGSVAQPLRESGVSHPYAKLTDIRDERPMWGGIEIDAFLKLLQRTENLQGFWNPAHGYVGGKALRNRLPAQLDLTPRFLQLLGYYIAEGCHQRGYFIIANPDESIREDIEAALNQLGIPFGVRPHSDYQVSSTALTALLGRLCGKKARSKHLPDFWPQLSQEGLGLLLRAYFDGDGTVGRASEVTATTASAHLASDLAYALLRLGIWARIKRRKRRATNTNHAGSWYYQLRISGQDNLRLFHELIGFSISYKQQALERQITHSGNTNVDVVPIRGAQLRWLRNQLGLSARELGGCCQISRSAVQFYEMGKRRPPRKTLHTLLDVLREKAMARNVSAQWWRQWRAIRQLCDVRWASIASVAAIDYEHPYVYDFTVPGPETFLAGTGGLFVHNTFSMSAVIQNLGKPTLVMSHNKTLAAQLYAEFKQFFPENAVEFFISYYDYYQPEAYIVKSDTYIEKDMAVNDRIDRLRLRTTSALVSGRQDVIVVASVSCIYGLGSPDEYKAQIVQLRPGQEIERNELLAQFITIFYVRNDVDFVPGTFRVRGDVVDLFPAYLEETAYRIAFWGDEIEKISVIHPLTGETLRDEALVTIYPAKIFVTPADQMERALASIEDELRWRLAVLREDGKMLEAQRLEQRTRFDIEMMKEVGYCSGIENYSRHLSDRAPGERPYCLFDYFPDDFLLVVDESHVTIPQVRAMYNGDRARKLTLVEHGFRLPSALDNRPMTFEEFEAAHHQTVYVTATPGDYELEKSGGVFVEQVIRPTGIPDPVVEVRPTENQIDDLLDEIRTVMDRGERVLVTTLTKRMAEDLTEYLESFGVTVRYLHSDIDALTRVELLRDLRLGAFAVLIGVNLLREGLDLPEVSLVAILDADKEGFLRSERSLIQTAGRAARNVNSKILLYADRVTGSMQRMMDETTRRRTRQIAYNKAHNITPKTVLKDREQIIRGTVIAEENRGESEAGSRHTYSLPNKPSIIVDPVLKYLTDDQKRDLIAQMRTEMLEAAEALEFERAVELRDALAQLEEELTG